MEQRQEAKQLLVEKDEVASSPGTSLSIQSYYFTPGITLETQTSLSELSLETGPQGMLGQVS